MSFDLETINNWLMAQGTEPFSQKEWRYIKNCDKYLSSGQPERDFRCKHPHTWEWIKLAGKTDPVTPQGALLHHWLVGEPLFDSPSKKQILTNLVTKA